MCLNIWSAKMDILNLLLFGFIVYTALVLVPGMFEEFCAKH